MGKKHVTLVLIHKRNIACSYCYEHSKDAANMPLEVAKQVLSAELNAKNDFDPLDIDLFRGEPFMTFDVIDPIVSFLRNETFQKSWSLPTIANGTVLANMMKGRLTKNRDIPKCVLGYNGTRDMQRINRGASTADLIDLSFFATTFLGEPIKMAVSRETLPRLAEGAIFSSREGLPDQQQPGEQRQLARGLTSGHRACTA